MHLRAVAPDPADHDRGLFAPSPGPYLVGFVMDRRPYDLGLSIEPADVLLQVRDCADDPLAPPDDPVHLLRVFQDIEEPVESAGLRDMDRVVEIVNGSAVDFLVDPLKKVRAVRARLPMDEDHVGTDDPEDIENAVAQGQEEIERLEKGLSRAIDDPFEGGKDKGGYRALYPVRFQVWEILLHPETGALRIERHRDDEVYVYLPVPFHQVITSGRGCGNRRS